MRYGAPIIICMSVYFYGVHLFPTVLFKLPKDNVFISLLPLK